MLEVIEKYNQIVIMNDGESTRLDPNLLNSAVDLTVATTDIAHNIEWNIMEGSLVSDHYTIFMTLCRQRKMEDDTIYPTTKWNSNKADGIQYTTVAENYLRQIPTIKSRRCEQ